jgi:hypothetical protein
MCTLAHYVCVYACTYVCVCVCVYVCMQVRMHVSEISVYHQVIGDELVQGAKEDRACLVVPIADCHEVPLFCACNARSRAHELNFAHLYKNGSHLWLYGSHLVETLCAFASVYFSLPTRMFAFLLDVTCA